MLFDTSVSQLSGLSQTISHYDKNRRGTYREPSSGEDGACLPLKMSFYSGEAAEVSPFSLPSLRPVFSSFC